MKPEVGQKAPDFSTQDQDGITHSLAGYKGKKIALYFYPKDDTSGCTSQACNLRDNYADILARNYQVLGVSVDDVKSHGKFAKKYSLPFPLLADVDHKMVEAYDVWHEKSMYGRKYMGIVRTTFIIDEDGKIERIINKVDTEDHSRQILG